MDAITLLKNDHKTVEQLFKRFEKAGDRALAEKRRVVDRTIEELSMHAAIEEQVFYPVVRATVAKTDDEILESLEEHHIVKWVLSELEGMDPSNERFDAKVAVLIENVRHHVREEEHELFPLVRRELGRASLDDLGESLAETKQHVSKHPHPRFPDTPPANVVSGAVSGVVDRVTDTVSGLTQGGVAAVEDLVARIRSTQRRAMSPRGTSTTRSTANSVRRASAAATNGAERTAKTAKRGASRTAKSARSSVRRTASTAESGARRTASTAKSSARRTASTAKSGTRRTASTAKSSARHTASTAKSGAKRTASAARSRTRHP